jgi:hypothetical protein
VPGGDLHVAQIDASVKHGRDERVAEHVLVCPGDLDASVRGEVPEAAGGCMPVHPGAAGVQQDRPAGSGACGPVESPADRGWQRDQDDLGALAAHAQHPVAVLLTEVSDIRGGGLEDPQAQQAEHGHQGEVARMRRFAGSGEQSLELQVGEAQGGRLSRDDGAPYVLSG